MTPGGCDPGYVPIWAQNIGTALVTIIGTLVIILTRRRNGNGRQ